MKEPPPPKKKKKIGPIAYMGSKFIQMSTYLGESFAAHVNKLLCVEQCSYCDANYKLHHAHGRTVTVTILVLFRVLCAVRT